MSSNEFIKDWTQDGDKLFYFENSYVESLSESTKLFLKTVGLPDRAAPYLSFSSKTFLPVDQVWKHKNMGLENYLLLGSDGAGSPICLDKNENVVLLDHETDFEVVFMNSSVKELAYSLLRYKQFINDILQRLGPDALLDGKYTLQEINNLQQDLLVIDKTALGEKSFWAIELQTLKANIGIGG